MPNNSGTTLHFVLFERDCRSRSALRSFFRAGYSVAHSTLFRDIRAMANDDDRPPPVVGVYWIDESDYPALLATFADGSKLPRTWKEWLRWQRRWNEVSRLTATPSCAFASIQPHFRIGVLLTAPAQAAKAARNLSQRPYTNGTAIRTENVYETVETFVLETFVFAGVACRLSGRGSPKFSLSVLPS